MTEHQHARDVLATLERYRPAEQDLDAEWGITQRDDALTTIFDASREKQPRIRRVTRHRRSVAVGAVAAGTVAATVVAGVLLPSGSPGGPHSAAAAALERLAVVAGQSGGRVGPHQFAYVREDGEQILQAGEAVVPGQVKDGNLARETSQRWTAPSGDTWLYRALGRPTACLRAYPYRPAPPGVNDYENLPAAALAALPTNPTRLKRYLEAHPEGQNRGAANVVGAVGDIVRSGLASPALRAASIRALARTGGIHVTVGARDALGRPAIRVDKRYEHGGTMSLFFDPRTSRLLEEQDQSLHDLFRSVVRESSIADSIPAGLPTCPGSGDPPG